MPLFCSPDSRFLKSSLDRSRRWIIQLRTKTQQICSGKRFFTSTTILFSEVVYCKVILLYSFFLYLPWILQFIVLFVSKNFLLMISTWCVRSAKVVAIGGLVRESKNLPTIRWVRWVRFGAPVHAVRLIPPWVREGSKKRRFWEHPQRGSCQTRIVAIGEGKFWHSAYHPS